MNPVRIGLVGCGWFARAVQLPILARAPQAEVVALADSDPGSLRAAGRLAPAAAGFGDVHSLLEKGRVDALVVSLPTALHAEASIAALRRGIHLYLEKPIATTLDEARAILDVWRRTNTVGMIGFNYRFNRLHRSAKRSVETGALGRVVGIKTAFSARARVLPAWKASRSTGGGALMELASHHFDLLRFYFGREVRTVSAEVHSRQSEDDTAVVRLELAGGLRVDSRFSLNAEDEDRIEIVGDQATLTLDRFRSLSVAIRRSHDGAQRRGGMDFIKTSVAGLPYAWEKLFAPWHEPSYQHALGRFLRAVREREPIEPDLNDGYRSLETVCAAERSARTGRPVAVGSGSRASNGEFDG